jgi:hypothetical protein
MSCSISARFRVGPDNEGGVASVGEGFIMHVTRQRPWRFSATVWLFGGKGSSASDPRELVTVQALTRRGARGRAAHIIASRHGRLSWG